MTEIQQPHILPASARPLPSQVSQKHLLQTSRNSCHASTNWESKAIYQTDSLVWPRCCYRRCRLISRLSPLLYLCPAISFYLISLFSPLFYPFFPCIFVSLMSTVGKIGAGSACVAKEWERWESWGKTEDHSLWLHDL